MANKVHTLNQLALWLPMNKDELDVKTFGTGYPYEIRGGIFRATKEQPVVRYAKNYEVGKTKFSLCLISLEQDVTEMEKWLDAEALKIKEKQVKSGDDFTKLKVFYGKYK